MKHLHVKDFNDESHAKLKKICNEGFTKPTSFTKEVMMLVAEFPSVEAVRARLKNPIRKSKRVD